MEVIIGGGQFRNVCSVDGIKRIICLDDGTSSRDVIKSQLAFRKGEGIQ